MGFARLGRACLYWGGPGKSTPAFPSAMTTAGESGQVDRVTQWICVRFSTSSTSISVAFLSETVGLGAETTMALLRSNAAAWGRGPTTANSNSVSKRSINWQDADRGTGLTEGKRMNWTLSKLRAG